MAKIDAIQVKNIRIEKKTYTDRYQLNTYRYIVNDEEFDVTELYELFKDIRSILPLNYDEDRQD